MAGGGIELSSPPDMDDITNTMGTQHAMCPHMCTNTVHCTCHQEYLIGTAVINKIFCFYADTKLVKLLLICVQWVRNKSFGGLYLQSQESL